MQDKADNVESAGFAFITNDFVSYPTGRIKMLVELLKIQQAHQNTYHSTSMGLISVLSDAIRILEEPIGE